MIRVAVAVRSPAVRAAIERALAQRALYAVVAPSSQGDADVVFVDAAEWTSRRSPRRRGDHARPEGDGAPAVIALADSLDDSLVARALRSGAHGVLSYDASVAELTAAVEAAAAGLVVVPASVGAVVASVNAPRVDSGPAHEEGALTDREREVLALLALGLPNHGIGERLGISEHTVKTYVAAILEKLDAATRAEAVAIGLRRGLLLL